MDSPDTSLNTFTEILKAFRSGMLRLHESELAFHRLALAVKSHHLLDDPNSTPNGSEALAQLAAIRHSSFDAFSYIGHLSHLIYATSLLDTFLTDTTRFLLMLHPSAIGKDFKISVSDLLTKETKIEILSNAAEKKAREISFGSFLQRIQFLADRFGLRMDLPDTQTSELEHYSSLRNTVVHDQGFLRLHINEFGEVIGEQHTCRVHPTIVDIDDLRRAYKAYQYVFLIIGRSVLQSTLKAPEDQAAFEILDFAESALTPKK